MLFKKIEKSQTESISISVRDLIMRQKKYLNIIKFEMYKKNSSQKLNIFVRACCWKVDRWSVAMIKVEVMRWVDEIANRETTREISLFEKD
jgi:hypothetical protein